MHKYNLYSNWEDCNNYWINSDLCFNNGKIVNNIEENEVLKKKNKKIFLKKKEVNK